MFKNLKISFIISSILYMVLGAILLIWPNTSMQVICYAFGGITLLYGLARLSSYLGNRENPSVLQGDLFFGIIMMGIGIFLLLKPDIILSILPIVIGLFIIFNSIIKVQYGFELKTDFYDKWWILLYLGIATAILGTIVALNPFKALETTVRVMGSFLVVDGVANIFTVLFVTIVLHRLKKAAADLALVGTGAESVIEKDSPEVTDAKPVFDIKETNDTTANNMANSPAMEPAALETQPTVSEVMENVSQSVQNDFEPVNTTSEPNDTASKPMKHSSETADFIFETADTSSKTSDN